MSTIVRPPSGLLTPRTRRPRPQPDLADCGP
mgnify:CR=1 FL=1